MVPTRPIDMSYDELALALGRACSASSLHATLPCGFRRFRCLSVRSGFDLMLGALALPSGSEVLVSAIELDDMRAILAHHGLVPVPVDLDPHTLAPTQRALELGLSRRTRALLVVHLFGGRVELEPLRRFALRHKLWLWEDCAQGYVGGEPKLSPHADASFYSFGKLKTHTAAGGALVFVRSRLLASRMGSLHSQYPQQSQADYIVRLAQLACVKALTSERPYTILARICERWRTTPQDVLGNATRGFSDGALVTKIRQQPCPALIEMLRRRERGLRVSSVERRRERARLADALLPPFIFRPGHASVDSSHWLYPICVAQPRAAVEALRAQGFDAVSGSSRLCVVAPPPSHPQSHPTAAFRLLSGLVYLPVSEASEASEVARLARALRELPEAVLAPPAFDAVEEARKRAC